MFTGTCAACPRSFRGPPPPRISALFPLGDNVSRKHEPIVVWAIIGLNIAAFLYESGLSPREVQVLFYQHALVPARYFRPSWAWQVGLSPTDFSPFVTNTFLHAGWLRLILNMWTLWIFGPALEDRIGPVRFAILYVLAGIAASATHAIFNATSAMPVLGASGAISGVIAAYALRFPYAWVRVLVLIVFIPLFFGVPAMLFAGIWFFSQVLQGTSELLSPFGGSGIAWWAHIGGFVSGWVLLHWLERSVRPAVRYNGGPWECARSQGKVLGRPVLRRHDRTDVEEALRSKMSIRATMRLTGASLGTVSRMRSQLVATGELLPELDRAAHHLGDP